MPKVSIVMPVFNGEAYIKEAIDSIITQTFTDWEFIIINEYGSNDIVTNILNDYEKQDSRIRIIQNKTRLGIAESLNVGLKSAKGEYIARMDADDISNIDRLEKQVEYMDSHPEISACGTRFTVFGDNAIGWEIELDSEQIDSDIIFYSPSVHPTIMFRTKFLHENNILYNSSYVASEDYDIFARICINGHIANINQNLFKYRLMNNNATFRNDDVGRKIYVDVIISQLKRLDLNLTYEEVELISPHQRFEKYQGVELLEKFDEIEWILKKILLANYKKKVFNHKNLAKTLHKKFTDSRNMIKWHGKKLEEYKLDEIYRHSVFSRSNFGIYPSVEEKVNSPIVTVLMPTYNSERYIYDTIDSILNQTYKDFEFLIINEKGSDDLTIDFINCFKDSRIKVIQNEERLGLADSLNLGMRISRGKYIARVDADDTSNPYRLEKQVDFLEKNQEYGLCGTWQHHWGIETEWNHCPPTEHEQLKTCFIYRCELCHSTLMLRKSTFIDNELFYDKTKAAEDFELWTRAIYKTKFYNIPEILGEYRVGKYNISAKKMQALSSESGEIAAKLLKEKLNVNVPDEHIKYMSSWINEFNNINNYAEKQRHLNIEKKILKKMWESNKQSHVYDDNALLVTINQRWRWVTNDWVFGTKQDKIEPIEKLFNSKQRKNGAKIKIRLKNNIKKILSPFYRPIKKRINAKVELLQRQIWDIDGHLYDYYNKLETKIEQQNEYISQLQNILIEQIKTSEKTINHSMYELLQNINQTTDERIWKAEQQINQTTDERIWKAEQQINQTTDERIWKAEQQINQTTDGRIWKAEQDIKLQIENGITEVNRHIDFTYRDIMVAMERQKSFLPQNDIKLVTEYPIAYESLDHLYPHGTIRDNTRYPRFVEKCEEVLGRNTDLSFLDLGCSGGGMVLEAALRGHTSIGLEGSDSSKKEQRAEWRLLGDRLQTCDITKPFKLINKDGTLRKFNIITAWEVMEHIAENDLTQMLKNIEKHLSDDGYFVASIANWSDIDPESGVNWHVTLHDYEWWIQRFENAGFKIHSDLFKPIDMARGAYNPPHCYQLPTSDYDVEHNFFIVASVIK